MYTLRKSDDPRIGDSGGMSMAIAVDRSNIEPKVIYEHDSRPRVGVHMRVGSRYARSYDHQDYWQTNVIVEILEETPTHVKFRTESGSIYDWTCKEVLV